MSFIRSSLLASLALGIAACSVNPTQQSSQAPAQAPVKTTPPASPLPKPVETAKEIFRETTFAALPGWSSDDLRETWPAFLASCDVLGKKDDWKEPCGIARDVNHSSEKAVRLFFESFFTPHQVIGPDGADAGLVTGYYEPLLRGARKRGGPY